MFHGALPSSISARQTARSFFSIPRSPRSIGARRKPSTATVRPIGISTRSGSSSLRLAPIGELDRVLPVDVIVVSACGSTLGCVDEKGELATPIMDYLAEPPAEIAEAYAKIAPAFAETFCNTWPAALSLGRQLFWLETAFPKAFARVRSIMTWSQYLAFRLGGRQTCEVSTLGAFSQLLDVLKGDFSSLVRQRGWADRFAPLTRAWEDIGELKREFRPAAFSGRGRILCGVHDISMPTICVTLPPALASSRCFRPEPSSSPLKAKRTSIVSIPIARRSRTPTCSDARSVAAVSSAASNSTSSSPALRLRGRRRRTSRRSLRTKCSRCRHSATPTAQSPEAAIAGASKVPSPEIPGQRASLATLYTALMMSEALDAVESRSPIVIDGPFSRNDLFVFAAGGAASAPTRRFVPAAGGNGRRRGRARSDELQLATCRSVRSS